MDGFDPILGMIPDLTKLFGYLRSDQSYNLVCGVIGNLKVCICRQTRIVHNALPSENFSSPMISCVWGPEFHAVSLFGTNSTSHIIICDGSVDSVMYKRTIAEVDITNNLMIYILVNKGF